MTTAIGRTAIGLACMRNYPDILNELLLSCTNQQSETVNGTTSGNTPKDTVETKKWRKHDLQSMENVTPEGMEGLQWEDEIIVESPTTTPSIPTSATSAKENDEQRIVHAKADETEKDDEWSVLYRYYASVIEKTGEMLANTISSREPHCLDAFRQAPIHYAASAGSYECMELLLKHSAPINMTNNSGHTALHLAVHQPKIVELLLQHKASPNKLTFYDQLAAIHLAAKIGNTETVCTILF